MALYAASDSRMPALAPIENIRGGYSLAVVHGHAGNVTVVAKPVTPDGIKVVASNRAARHNFFIEDTYECGLVLRGSEVKSLRDSKVQITESFKQLSGGEMWLHNLHIAQYEFSQGHSGHEPLRVRKLLLHRREIDRIAAKLKKERLSLVPTRLYFKEGRAKVEIGIGRGKKATDKRQDLAKRDAEREMARQLKGVD